MVEGVSKGPAGAGRREAKERPRSLVDSRRTDRMLGPIAEHKEEISVGSLKICDRQKKVFIYGKGKRLTPLEYELLRTLATEEGRVLSNGELVQKLRRRKWNPDPEDIKKYIYRLRKKIEPDPRAPRWIQNVKGAGYQLIVDDDDNATR